jgi:para-nitrobenzyl esterase
MHGDKMTDFDKAMGRLASAYWVSFGQTGDPNDDDRPEWPRHNPSADRVTNLTDDGVL